MFTLPDFTALKLSALDATANGVVITDSVGTILWVNAAFTSLTGYSLEEAVGKNPRVLKSGIQHVDVYKNLWSTILSGDSWTGKLVNRRKDGSFYTEKMNITPIKTSGIITHFIAIKQDITSEIIAQDKTDELTRFLDSIVANLPDFVFVKDAKELRFVRVNKAGEEFLGFSAEELIGKNDYDFFPKDQADFFTDFDHRVLQNKVTIDIPEEPINTKNHGRRILHTKKVPILDAKGSPVFLMGISEDITESKANAQKLAEKMLELEKINEIMVNRELKMIELKEQLAKYVSK